MINQDGWIKGVKTFVEYTFKDLHMIKTDFNRRSTNASSRKVREPKPFMGMHDPKGS